MSIVRRVYLIHGRVQGVGFRMFARDSAKANGVQGWVRNISGENSVEVVAEADIASVDKFEAALRHGPPDAVVDRFEVAQADATGEVEGFSIRR